MVGGGIPSSIGRRLSARGEPTARVEKPAKSGTNGWRSHKELSQFCDARDLCSCGPRRAGCRAEPCRTGERSPGVRPKTDPAAILRTEYTKFLDFGTTPLGRQPRRPAARPALLPELE